MITFTFRKYPLLYIQERDRSGNSKLSFLDRRPPQCLEKLNFYTDMPIIFLLLDPVSPLEYSTEFHRESHPLTFVISFENCEMEYFVYEIRCGDQRVFVGPLVLFFHCSLKFGLRLIVRENLQFDFVVK